MRTEWMLTVQANIVWVMKARKLLEHNNLIAEIIKQVTLFKPEPSFIKEAIEKLIEDTYLERDPSNNWNYKYVP